MRYAVLYLDLGISKGINIKISRGKGPCLLHLSDTQKGMDNDMHLGYKGTL